MIINQAIFTRPMRLAGKMTTEANSTTFDLEIDTEAGVLLLMRDKSPTIIVPLAHVLYMVADRADASR